MYDQVTTDAPEGTRSERCPECGALNPAGAQWCGLCLTRRREPKAPPPPPPRPAGQDPAASPPPAAGVTRGAFTVTEAGVEWTCGVCQSSNPIDERACAVCGASFAATLRPDQDRRPERDPGTTALYSLLWPGAGHGYLGLWGQAISRAVLSAWVLLAVVVTAVQNGPFHLVPALLAAISLGLWLAAAHDSYREARREPALVLLKERYFLFVVLGVLFLLFGLLLVQGLQTGSAPRSTDGVPAPASSPTSLGVS